MQNFTNFDGVFLMRTDMTAVTIKSNKIFFNEVKNNWALLEPLYGKKPEELFGHPNKFDKENNF